MTNTVNTILLLMAIGFNIEMVQARKDKAWGYYVFAGLLSGICAAAFVSRLSA